jgi:acid phosphatase family membrane protein YuiD
VGAGSSNRGIMWVLAAVIAVVLIADAAGVRD